MIFPFGEMPEDFFSVTIREVKLPPIFRSAGGYGLLHSSDYRVRFVNDLTKMLPRVPLFEDVKLFRAYLNAGRKLAVGEFLPATLREGKLRRF